jgi:hypothetical protein
MAILKNSILMLADDMDLIPLMFPMLIWQKVLICNILSTIITIIPFTPLFHSTH